MGHLSIVLRRFAPFGQVLGSCERNASATHLQRIWRRNSRVESGEGKRAPPLEVLINGSMVTADPNFSNIAMSNRGTPTSPSSFDDLLSDLVIDARQAHHSAAQVLSSMLTFGGRLPWSLARARLDERETVLFEWVQKHPALCLDERSGADCVSLEVQLDAHGKLSISGHDMAPRACALGPVRPIGRLFIPLGEYRLIEQEITLRRQRERECRQSLVPLLEQADRTGQLAELVADVEDSVRHVEAVLLYIDGQHWSVAEGCSTLIDKNGKEGILRRLARTPLSKWTLAEQFGVIALRALFLSGRSVRFEEFNGAQLSALRLLERFGELEAAYATAKGTAILPVPNSLFERAAAIQAAAGSLTGKPYVRHRVINGVTYVKTERVVATPRRSHDQALPEELASLCESWLSRPRAITEPPEQVLARLTQHALLHPDMDACSERRTPAGSALERLMECVVSSAVRETGSDYGMSSSFRDVSVLMTQNSRDLHERVLRLKPLDFFTCVVSRAGLFSRFGKDFTKHIYAAVQKRMQFNRWHFIAGNFQGDVVPTSRHYYYPPLIPDIAEWADLHHGGHINGRVRYSIRAPGPDMGLSPLRIGAHEYRGFYDVRVVRCEGPAFTVDEMLTVRRHCLWMGSIWRTLIAHVERHGPVAIVGFQNGEGLELSAAAPAQAAWSEPARLVSAS